MSQNLTREIKKCKTEVQDLKIKLLEDKQESETRFDLVKKDHFSLLEKIIGINTDIENSQQKFADKNEIDVILRRFQTVVTQKQLDQKFEFVEPLFNEA